MEHTITTRTLNPVEVFHNARLFATSIVVPNTTVETAMNIPAVNPEYLFSSAVLNEITMFLSSSCDDCLYLSGPTGCGKTTAVLQTAAWLKYPIEQLTCSSRTESADLIGHTVLKDGTLGFEYGPLVRAMLNGELLLLNEIDLMQAGELAALNDVLEGRPLTIVANKGEVIKPHPCFRLIATGNSKGNGDNTASYAGVRLLNSAFLDRFRFIEVDYMDARSEAVVLKHALPNLQARLGDSKVNVYLKFAELASELRGIKADPEAEEEDLDGSMQISTPFSTRTLLRIARIYNDFPQVTICKAVDMGFASRLVDAERKYVLRLVKDLFGHKAATQTVQASNDLLAEVKKEVESGRSKAKKAA